MTISDGQIQSLLEMLLQTKDEEASCEDCLEYMAEFAESALTRMSVPESLQIIDDHVQFCGECREEFEALKRALNSGFRRP